MYLDRSDISFRKEDEKELLEKDKITVFRPENRKYPQNRGYIDGEVVKARVIAILGDDKKKTAPVFSNTVKMVKIQTTKVVSENELGKDDFDNSLKHIQSKEDVKKHLKQIYNKDFTTITKIDIEKIHTDNLIDNSHEIKELFESGTMKFATLPETNVTDIDEILHATNFSFTFINHDYAGITPKMRNHIADIYHLDIKNAMVIIKPEDFEKSLDVLEKNDKYIGGGLGVGFKDAGRKLLKQKKYGFINPVADEMQSINFIAHFGEELHGYNSDASGYADTLCNTFKEIGEDIQDKDIVLMGAGGTARGIALELVNRGVRTISIINRTLEKAEHIVKNLNHIKSNIANAGDENMIFELKDRKIDAIINLSTKGADGDFSSYSGLTPTAGGLEKNLHDTKELLEKFKRNNPQIIISDINLTKTHTTPLLDQAKELGLHTLDGKLMVVYQGVQAIWTVFGDKIIQAGGTKEDIQKELLKLIFPETK